VGRYRPTCRSRAEVSNLLMINRGVARPKLMLRMFTPGVKWAAIGPLAGPGQSPGRGFLFFTI
jgi:hypothetical protein